jgi:hypothetical protein
MNEDRTAKLYAGHIGVVAVDRSLRTPLRTYVGGFGRGNGQAP